MKPYAMSLEDISLVSDIVCALDASCPQRSPDIVALVVVGHAVIQRALGADVGLIYAPEDTPS